MAKILIVEDDKLVAGLACQYLSDDQHIIEVAETVEDAEERIRLSPFDLFILDWQLPGGSGIEICRRLRASGASVPILIITGKSSILEKAAGYDSGADDYLTKPFDMRELRMKVRALLRRGGNMKSEVVECGPLVLEADAARVLFHGQELRLQPQEYALLSHFMHHPGVVFGAEQLLQQAWQSDEEVTEIALRSCIAKLRKKLRVIDESEVIKTMAGYGYKLEC